MDSYSCQEHEGKKCIPSICGFLNDFIGYLWAGMVAHRARIMQPLLSDCIWELVC